MICRGTVAFVLSLGLLGEPLLADTDFIRNLTAKAKSIEATVDYGEDLDLVLEKDRLQGSCDRHFSRLDPETQQLPDSSLNNDEHISDMVRCGKWIFFFANFESDVAFPENIIRYGLSIFKEETGPAFENYGMIENPGTKGLPVGMVPLKGNPWGLSSLVTGKPVGITCAACHFGKTDENTYSVGKYNHDLEFGKVNAFLMFPVWLANSKKKDEEIWPASITEHYNKMDRTLKRTLNPRRALDSVRLVSWVRLDNSFYKLVNLSSNSRRIAFLYGGS